jgi:hypothetical protein
MKTNLRNQVKKPNLVAKYNHLVNTAKTFKDRKKDSKRGYIKHKGDK